MTAHIHPPVGLAETVFTEREALALEELRLRFQEDHDVFSRHEREQLRFLRWLVRTGRIEL